MGCLQAWLTDSHTSPALEMAQSLSKPWPWPATFWSEPGSPLYEIGLTIQLLLCYFFQ